MGARIPVTVAIPVKNEERNLPRCLERLRRFAEVIVVDSSSTDATPAIAREFGVPVVNFEWNGRFPKKRNWLLMNHTFSTEWILFLDADEFVDDAFCDAVAKAVQSDKHDGYWLNYTNYFLDRPLRYGVAQRKLPLFRIGKALYERIDEDGWSKLDVEVHEHPIVEGSVGEIRTPIDHRDYNGLAIFLERHRDYALWESRRYEKLRCASEDLWRGFTPRQSFKYRNINKWWFSLFYFLFTYIVKGGIFDGEAGFHYAAYKAWYFRTIRLLIRENARDVSL